MWIVIEEGEFGEDVSGVFGTQDEAAEYAEAVAAENDVVTRYTSFPVPYRLRDRSSVLRIGEG